MLWALFCPKIPQKQRTELLSNPDSELDTGHDSISIEASREKVLEFKRLFKEGVVCDKCGEVMESLEIEETDLGN